MSLAEIADLTPRQIHDLYAHPRDKDGRIAPREPVSAASEAAEFVSLASFFGLAAQAREKLAAEKAAKEAEKPNG